ncbi:DUF948 domain-containing protein [Paenibacillus sp. YYML68]|uniref:DUF948 domain-containing protein n=1 Tax=Paenibacillus sp. YYML68 TaxID=2909250 RepID=UPI0024924771|nr:DUF948 domain-containing protein [Paenibacillus sp. YYML68]
MWWQWGLAVCMIAFIAVAVSVIRFLFHAQSAMKRTETSLLALQHDAHRAVAESVRTLETSAAILGNVKRKLEATDAWFEAASETGEAVRSIIRTVDQLTQAVEATVTDAKKAVQERQDTFSGALECSAAVFSLISRIQASRPTKTKE